LLGDAATMRYIRAPLTDAQQVRERIDIWDTYARKCPGFGVFGLELKENGDFAGYATARHTDFNPETGEYEIGYVIAPVYWGRGLATEIVPPLCRYIFESTGAPYIVAFTDPGNSASQKVLLKCGFDIAGTRLIYEGVSTEFRLQNSETRRV
jgi:RimJ/RimL family protein N-acetyltransferase